MMLETVALAMLTSFFERSTLAVIVFPGNSSSNSQAFSTGGTLADFGAATSLPFAVSILTLLGFAS